VCGGLARLIMGDGGNYVEDPDPDFVNSWNLEYRVYGIIHLLQCRAMMPVDCPKPAEVAHLKYLACGARILGKRHNKFHKDRAASGARALSESPAVSTETASSAGSMAPEVHDGELVEVWADAGHAGSWWRILGQDEIIVRKDISLFSEELRRLKPGCKVQQAGLARRFVSGQMNGIVRVPVRASSWAAADSGWVTADARSAGGPQFLEKTEAPRWLVIYESGLPHGDVLVRAGSDLESKEVAVLRNGDIVEQAGPQEFHSGVVRMPVAVPEGAATLQVSSLEVRQKNAGGNRSLSGAAGWVTVDARSAGGPVFLQALSV